MTTGYRPVACPLCGIASIDSGDGVTRIPAPQPDVMAAVDAAEDHCLLYTHTSNSDNAIREAFNKIRTKLTGASGSNP